MDHIGDFVLAEQITFFSVYVFSLGFLIACHCLFVNYDVVAMNAKKALKKLKKKVEKVPSRSAEQLMRLGQSVTLSAASTVAADEGIKKEVRDISQQALLSAVSELATPINPVLSWFNEGGDLHLSSASSIRSAVKLPNTANAKLALVRLPLKSPPCRRCPALNRGVCKCAAKKFNLNT